MSMTYGIDIESADNPFLSANLEATQGLATALVPGKFLVDTIPIRRCPNSRTTPTDDLRNHGQYNTSHTGSLGRGSRFSPTKCVKSTNYHSMVRWST